VSRFELPSPVAIAVNPLSGASLCVLRDNQWGFRCSIERHDGDCASANDPGAGSGDGAIESWQQPSVHRTEPLLWCVVPISPAANRWARMRSTATVSAAGCEPTPSVLGESAALVHSWLGSHLIRVVRRQRIGLPFLYGQVHRDRTLRHFGEFQSKSTYLGQCGSPLSETRGLG